MALTAHTGLVLPSIGLGTYKLNGSAGARDIGSALSVGYRLLDSAFNYENEGAVGAAVRGSDVPREEVLVTSKLPGRHHAYDQALRTIEESVFRTGLEGIDLYLIHWPNPITDKYVEAWRALIAQRDAGLIRHIGVSNFLPEHLMRLADETGELPAVNQIELHPYFAQGDAVAFHAEHGIITEAWSPVGRGNDVAEAPVVQEVAQAHGISGVQAILAWHVARGVLPLPKSANPERQGENLAAADVVLSSDEVASITALSRTDGRLKDQDPARCEEF